MMLSEHISYTEFICSDTARRRGIENIPDAEQLTHAIALCVRVLEPVRALFDKPLHVSSGYRCPELNSVIGGSKTSQHMDGEAADFEIEGVSVPDVFWKILTSKIPFDQLINEFGEWVHVSYCANGRREALVALKKAEGETEYKLINPSGA
jgi:zinc D-Ala-D-Ala carboxypeptidase